MDETSAAGASTGGYGHLNTDEPDRWDQNECVPGVGLFGDALQVWSMAQPTPTTVADAALAFCCTREIIEQAVEHHAWMLLGENDVIEHDGE